MKLALLVAVGCGTPPIATLPSYQIDTLHIDGAPPLDPALRAVLAERAELHGDQLLDLSPDGNRVLALAAGYVVELSSSGVDPQGRVDFGAEPRVRPPDPDLLVDSALFSDGDAIVLVGDRGGDEQTRMYRQRAGRPELLDDHPRVDTPVWDRARHQLAWARAIDNRSELWLGDGAGAAHEVFAADGLWHAIDVADGALLAIHEVSDSTSTVYRIDTATGAATALTPITAGRAAPVARFGADGRVFAISDAGSDHRELVELPGGARDRLPAAGPRSLTAAIPWDVTDFAIAGDGSAIAFVTDEDGASVLRLHDVATGTQRAIGPTGGVIDHVVFAAAAPRFAFSITDATHPREIFSYDLPTARLAQWTIATALVARAPVLAHVSSGAITVPVLEYAPAAAHAPVLLELHGGPADQWQPSYDGFAQFLVAQGFAIVRPNVRGSLGYGRAFAALDDGRRREDAIADVGATLRWIATRPELDAGRVVVMGTSYGGYLALASLRAFPDRLRGAIDLVGIADFVKFLEGTSMHRRDQRRAEYGDERDPATRAFLAQISPIAHAGELRRPLLVAHGKRDSRVPFADADRLVRAVRAAGQPVWYLSADDEGHGFTRVSHRVVFQTLVTQFLRTVTTSAASRVVK